jgi:hypothetical protein
MKSINSINNEGRKKMDKFGLKRTNRDFDFFRGKVRG